MAEPEAEATLEERNQQDEDQVAELLHHINCDNVSTQELFRLGKYDSPQATPRPISMA